jgi:hypothetical protein
LRPARGIFAQVRPLDFWGARQSEWLRVKKDTEAPRVILRTKNGRFQAKFVRGDTEQSARGRRSAIPMLDKKSLIDARTALHTRDCCHGLHT